jgi:nitrogen fixation protein NifU and related proteins
LGEIETAGKSKTCRASDWQSQAVITQLPYSELFKDHLANPRNGGELNNANAVAEETNPVCGDRLRLSLRIRDDRIEAARFLAYGCPPTLACGSVLAEMLEGMSIVEALKLTRNQLADALGGLSPQKRHAAALAIATLHAAIEIANPA